MIDRAHIATQDGATVVTLYNAGKPVFVGETRAQDNEVGGQEILTQMRAAGLNEAEIAAGIGAMRVYTDRMQAALWRLMEECATRCSRNGFD